MKSPLTFLELQDFVDGRLSEQREREIEAILASDPISARVVERLRTLNEELRTIGDAALSAPNSERLQPLSSNERGGRPRFRQHPPEAAADTGRYVPARSAYKNGHARR